MEITICRRYTRVGVLKESKLEQHGTKYVVEHLLPTAAFSGLQVECPGAPPSVATVYLPGKGACTAQRGALHIH